MYEYKFTRLNVGLFSGNPEQDYRRIVERHAAEGWRLVQIFAPGIGAAGSARYFEIIFERAVAR
jgi:hypothetical protein